MICARPLSWVTSIFLIVQLDALRKKNAARSAAWVLRILKEQPVGFTDVRNLNVALEHAINYRILSDEQLKEIISHTFSLR